MALALTEELRQLDETADSFLVRHRAIAVARALLDAETEALPPFWPELAEMGWLGLHLPEEVGGSGYGLAELTVVLEALGRHITPGPFLPTVSASAILDAREPADAAAFKAWLFSVSQKVAEAASEGGFLGFGGVQVSDAERATLDDIAKALGIAAPHAGLKAPQDSSR